MWELIQYDEDVWAAELIGTDGEITCITFSGAYGKELSHCFVSLNNRFYAENNLKSVQQYLETFPPSDIDTFMALSREQT